MYTSWRHLSPEAKPLALHAETQRNPEFISLLTWRSVGAWMMQACVCAFACSCAFVMETVEEAAQMEAVIEGWAAILRAWPCSLCLTHTLFSHGKHKPIESVQTVMRRDPTTIGWIRLSAEHRRKQTTRLPFMGIQSQNPFSILSTINLFLEPRTWIGRAAKQRTAPHNVRPHWEELQGRFLEINNKGK